MNVRSLRKGTGAVLCGLVCALAPAGMASAESLPDGRVYEMVTPPENNFGSEVYQPLGSGVTAAFSGTQTEFPFQAAADGEHVAFVGAPTEGGSENSGYDGGNEYLGTRQPGGGWKQTNISPAGKPSMIYEGFSSDLSVGFMDATEPLVPSAPGFGETPEFAGNYDVLYTVATASSQFDPAFTIKPPNRTMSSFRTAQTTERPGFAGGSGGNRAFNNRVIAFVGASANSSRVLFMANDALTGASEGRPAAEGGAESSFEEKDNLYESVDGQLRLVNVLPDGTTHVGATFGSGTPFRHVISADGSRIFWTDRSTGHIYVRENDATTVEVSSAGLYQTASTDGSKAFYTNGDLYKYELAGGRTTDLTPGVTVTKVLGASEDGEYVYFVTEAGELEVWHDGVTLPIAASPVYLGEVTPDGHSVVYADSAGSLRGSLHVYDADTGQVYCASCTAEGTSGALQMTNKENTYQTRWISADGSRVFFDSYVALVPQDTNGQLDAYEWKRPGSEGCATGGGCVSLLSGGTSIEESYFIDASENGNDAFVVTRAKLGDADDNELYDLYDARVDGYVPLAPPACTGSGCQGIPGAPPIFATPSSVTFEGVGNFATPSKGAVKPKAKPKKKKSKPKKKSKAHKKKAKKSARKANGRGRSGSKGGRS
jgi:hypothetical protein